jgi:membrane-associated protease RseP (regulator of RpoE activity)
VPASLPYFIPVPWPPGTLGAIISMRDGGVSDRRKLLDIGAAGPLAGLLVAIPVLLWGIHTSRVISLDGVPPADIQIEGNSILYFVSKYLLKHAWLPGGGFDLEMNATCQAGWFGLFVTALNLLPIGQLDGGHVAYAVFGKRWQKLSWFVIAALALMGFFWLGWTFWAVLVVVLGLRHPPPLDDLTPLNKADWRLVAVAVLIMVLTLTPAPFGSVRL